MANQKPPEARVRDWLDSHGAALEMRTAEHFRNAGADVGHARYYVDRISGELRETDVRATFQRPSGHAWLTLHCIVECKSSRSDPWVLFMSDHVMMRQDRDLLALFEYKGRGGASVDNLGSLHRAPLLFWRRPHAYQVDDTASSKSNAYDAVRQVMSGVSGALADVPDPQDTDEPSLSIFVPIVVTAAPMFAVRLDHQGETQISQTDRAPLISRLRPLDQLQGVWLVNESATGQVASVAAQTIQGLTTSAV